MKGQEELNTLKDRVSEAERLLRLQTMLEHAGGTGNSVTIKYIYHDPRGAYSGELVLSPDEITFLRANLLPIVRSKLENL